MPQRAGPNCLASAQNLGPKSRSFTPVRDIRKPRFMLILSTWLRPSLPESSHSQTLRHENLFLGWELGLLDRNNCSNR